MVLILGACPATHAISGKDPLTRPMPTTPGDALPEGAGSPRQEVPQAWLRAICDRVEDCTVERNEALTRSYSGTEEDLRLSRLEARQALAQGVVRRWCELQVGRMPRSKAERVHLCLNQHQSCGAFYQCANYSVHMAQSHPARRP